MNDGTGKADSSERGLRKSVPASLFAGTTFTGNNGWINSLVINFFVALLYQFGYKGRKFYD